MARHVDVIEEKVNLIGFKGDDEENNLVNESKDSDNLRGSEEIIFDMNTDNNLDAINDRILNE